MQHSPKQPHRPYRRLSRVFLPKTLFALILLAVGLALTNGGPASAEQPIHTKAPQAPQLTATPIPTAVLEQQTVDLINQRRVAMGLEAFQVDTRLIVAARRHSNDIGPRGLCQHNGTDGSSPWDRINQSGYTGFGNGEVVGCGYQTAQAVVDAWWNSPAHYGVLTNPESNDIGCGWWLDPQGYGWQTCNTGITDDRPTSTRTRTATHTRTPTRTATGVSATATPITPTSTSTAAPPSPTRTPTRTSTRTQTNAPTLTTTRTLTSTPTRTPTAAPAPILVGHVIWQGRPGQPNVLQQLPVTLTLKLNGVEVNYPQQNTDANGFFTVSVAGLAVGNYTWRVKGPQFLANSGNVTLTGGPVSLEMGLLANGDANNDNVVSTGDFNIVKATFGRSLGQTGYDSRADFSGDQVVSASDFNLLRSTFGQAGSSPP